MGGFESYDKYTTESNDSQSSHSSRLGYEDVDVDENNFEQNSTTLESGASESDWSFSDREDVLSQRLKQKNEIARNLSNEKSEPAELVLNHEDFENDLSDLRINTDENFLSTSL